MYFLKFWLVFTLSSTLVSYSQKNSQNLEWIPFTWASDSISGKLIDKTGIIISVTIDELPHKFNMQLDLGAVTTCFYGKILNVYLEKYPALNNKLDTTKKFRILGEENPMFRNINLRLGKVAFRNVDVGLFRNFGDESSNAYMGVIAPDLFQNKVLIIDYKLSRLAVADTLSSEYQDVSFENFKTKEGRIKIPLLINGKVEDLLFDTGSSIFSLVTTKQNALEIGESEIVDSLIVPSWGENIALYGLKTVVPIMFGNKRLENSIVFYDENVNFDNFYKSEKIWGITGNAFFLNDVVIIDYKNNRFGVK